MRAAVLLLIIGAAAAWATEPEAPAAPAAQAEAPATPAPTAAAPAAATTAAASTGTKPADGPSADVLGKARALGLKPRVRKGVTMYCKETSEVGTRFTSERCYSTENLDSVVEQMRHTQEMMRKSGACATTNCGGS